MNSIKKDIFSIDSVQDVSQIEKIVLIKALGGMFGTGRGRIKTRNKKIMLKRTKGVIIKLLLKLALKSKWLTRVIAIIINKIIKLILVEG